jgi:cytochrome b pre-mRNA-processing protein 3
MRWFSDRHRRERAAAARIYAASVAAARRPELYLALGVPDTLQGRFEMIALHLFPVLHRLMHDPGDDPELARFVSETFVADMDASFREMGVGDLSVPKRMNALYRSFGGRMAAYKKGVEEGDAALLDAVARNIFPDGSAHGHALALKAHLATAVAAVRAADIEAIRRGDLPFPEPAPCKESKR